MRNRRTYFEQVPIAVVETILRQDPSPEGILERQLIQVPAVKRRATTGILKQKSNTPSKG
jgi:hypothetical protein